MKSLAFALATAAAIALSGPVWADGVTVYPPGQNPYPGAGPGNSQGAQAGNAQCHGEIVSRLAQQGGLQIGQQTSGPAGPQVTQGIDFVFAIAPTPAAPSLCPINP